ncbi:MAG: hypothetical protein LBS62_11340, partial [Clostridiales bacterium]|nr:hypothetical protein [Clostridiales bacterium]
MFTYNQAVEHVTESCQKSSTKNREYFAHILGLFGEPHEHLRVIHLAGTNGKESVCAMLASVLRQTDASVGVFTSPHLESYNERVTVNNAPIPDGDFAPQIELIARHSREPRMSYFEIMTPVAFHYFRQQAVDYAVIETGTGGLHDATNVVSRPLLSVITSVGRDHVAMLGGTIPEIASQKSGIIKRGRPAAVGKLPPEALDIVRAAASERGAALYYYVSIHIGRESKLLIVGRQKAPLSTGAVSSGVT